VVEGRRLFLFEGGRQTRVLMYCRGLCLYRAGEGRGVWRWSGEVLRVVLTREVLMAMLLGFRNLCLLLSRTSCSRVMEAVSADERCIGGY